MAGETVSMELIEDALRTRLLTFSPPSVTDKVADIVGANGLYWNRPPADAAYPFGILRLIGLRNGPGYGRERIQGSLELTLITRPADAQPVKDLHKAADLATGAMLWARLGDNTSSGTGLIFLGEGVRDDLPPPIEPVDEQTFQLRLLWTITIWPRFLTRYAHP